MADASLTVFGIRHHGPGCARSLVAALVALRPDAVLVEGPPDAQGVLPLMLQDGMQPPVAILVYLPETPQRAAFFPFANFSPEWQALRYALHQGIPALFMDLPQANRFAQAPTAAPPAAEEDPIAILAKAAGYDDHELWWDQKVEQRQDARDLFAAILEAMTALREEAGPSTEDGARREAAMRQTIRAAQREGFRRLAVVCGAWHAPALAAPGPARADAHLLSGLPKVKVQATWTPWTNSRLSYRSGYGAGVASPGWYEHLWATPDQVAVRWVTRAARLLRAEDLDASSAGVIEAVRLAEALAGLRDRPNPGLTDLNEAIRTVFCRGDAAPMLLIRNQLEIGETMGEVPAATPDVPLQRDLTAQQRRLRLSPAAEIRTLDLDLRNDTDSARSHLLHRLLVLGLDWGKVQPSPIKGSTFHEVWQLQWRVEFAVTLIEANVWGNTVETAASARLRHLADTATALPGLTALLDAAILARLPDAVDHLLGRVQNEAAMAADVHHLLNALPALARIARYGDVRKTRAEQVLPVFRALFRRAVVGLPAACASLDDDAAQTMVAGLDRAQESLDLLEQADETTEWQAALGRLVERDGVHGLVRGRCCRLLFERHMLDDEDLEHLARLALSPVHPPLQVAAWLEGALRGSGLLLLHQDGLWVALDRWLQALPAASFTELLPLVRRAFAGFQPPERRAMGEKVRHLSGTHHGWDRASNAPTNVDDLADIDAERAALVLPVLVQILGGGADGP